MIVMLIVMKIIITMLTIINNLVQVYSTKLTKFLTNLSLLQVPTLNCQSKSQFFGHQASFTENYVNLEIRAKLWKK